MLSCHASGAHSGYHLVAAFIADQLGDHRRASERQFVDHRHIQIGVIAHCQGARNGRCAHHELVGFVRLYIILAFVAQRETLLHTEFVLLVDNRQTEFVKADLLLEQRVRADGEQRFAGGDMFGGELLVFFFQAAGQPHRRDAERLQPVAQLEVMLLGEDFGGRHQRDLIAVLDHLQRGQRSDNGLTAADIAEQQTLHRMRLREVTADLGVGALLRFGQRERQVFYQACGKLPVWRKDGCKDRCDAFVAFAVMHAHRQLLRQQFVKLDAPPSGVAALFQRTGGNIRGEVMQQLDAVSEAGQF